jgi:hypothetical protein
MSYLSLLAGDVVFGLLHLYSQADRLCSFIFHARLKMHRRCLMDTSTNVIAWIMQSSTRKVIPCFQLWMSLSVPYVAHLLSFWIECNKSCRTKRTRKSSYHQTCPLHHAACKLHQHSSILTVESARLCKHSMLRKLRRSCVIKNDAPLKMQLKGAEFVVSLWPYVQSWAGWWKFAWRLAETSTRSAGGPANATIIASVQKRRSTSLYVTLYMQ